MTEYELVPTKNGVETQSFVPISAKFNKNIDTLFRNGIISCRYERIKSKPW